MTQDLKDDVTKSESDFAFQLFASTESAKAISAIDNLEALFILRTKIDDSPETRENERIFEKLRLVLTYAASTSPVFWPARGAKRQIVARCERLRNMVGLTTDHALGNRQLRNHIEHFDERLDEWLADTPRAFTCFEIAVYKDFHPETIDALLISVPVLIFESDFEIRLFGHAYKLANLKVSLEDVRDRLTASIQKEINRWPTR